MYCICEIFIMKEVNIMPKLFSSLSYGGTSFELHLDGVYTLTESDFVFI